MCVCVRLRATVVQNTNVFYIHGSVHRESNLITVQQDATYSVYYIYVGSYADDVNILGGSIHTLKENAEALVAATREIGL